MRLFFQCACGSKIHLQSGAATRNELYATYGPDINVNCPICRNSVLVPVNGVWAESKYDYAPVPGVAAGALAGVIAGPIGMIIGGVAGGITGNSIRVKDQKATNRFNNSYL